MLRHLVVCLFLAPVLTFAQATFGTITGTVTDSTGAVVPNTEVVVTNEGTNLTRTVVTGNDGNYVVPNLNYGNYRVQAKAAGFKTYVVRGIGLEALRTVRVDVRLEVGEVGTEVTIQGSAPVIETDTASIAAVRTGKDLNDLPLNIRSTVSGTGDSGLYRYVFMAPTGGQGGGSRFSLGGARGSQNYFNVDGISSNSPAFGNSIGPATPSFDSIQEVRFEIVNNKAEGCSPATVMSLARALAGADSAPAAGRSW